jgi:heme exporter protein A
MVYPELTAMENLLLFARLYELKDAKSSAKKAASRIGLQGFGRDRPVRVLSRGQLQRVALARAIIAKPQFLLLDEPATGLDGEAVGRIDAIVKELREQGGMAVLVTHEPEVASRMASRALMLSQGRVVADVRAPGDAKAWKQLYMKTVGT